MPRRFQADLALAFCSLIWGATFVLVKDALASASVFVFLALRFALATATLALLHRARLRGIDRRSLEAGALIGWFMFSGYALQTIGLQYTTPSKAAFITSSCVVMVPVFQAVFGRKRANGWVWAGAGAALAGLYLLTVPRAGLGGLNAGDLWVLACAVMWAFHILVVGHFSPRHSAGGLTFVQVAVAGALTALFLPLLAGAGWEAPRLRWTGMLLVAVAVTAVGSTAIAFSLQMWAQKFAAPAHVAILFSLEPVFAALTSAALYGERLAPRALAGAALVLAGVLAAELRSPPAAAPEAAISGEGLREAAE
ncbi:MAG TPA: DMT family transporter [Candidatus Acidoferrales bacterium]|nr:DMT family transporter [Candidatus Acidoferrales bacterium]